MIVARIFRAFAAAAVVAGLALGHSAHCEMTSVAVPALPATASSGVASERTDMTTQESTTQASADDASPDAMPADMDCCPKTRVPGHEPVCPLMALCVSAFVARAAVPAEPSLVAVTYHRPRISDEPGFAGLTPPPLPEPPRSTA